MRKNYLMTSILLCLSFFSWANALNGNTQGIVVNNEGNIFTLIGQSIYQFNQNGNFKKIINDSINDIFGEMKPNGESYVGVGLIDGKRIGTVVAITKKDITYYAKEFKCKPILEEIVQRSVYPKYINVNNLNDNIYVLGEDIFRKNYKLGILDPNDGHPISVFSAIDRDMLKTRAKRVEEFVNRESFEKKAALLEYIHKNREIINNNASRIHLDKMFEYIPYDKSDGQFKWADFKRDIAIEWNKGEVANPQGLAVDKEGNFYITDYWDSTVKIFKKNGDYVGLFGSYGMGDGQFKAIKGIAIDDKNGWVYVTDTYFPSMFRGNMWEGNQMRVQKFTKEGKFILKWGEKKIRGFRLLPPMLLYEYELDEPDGIAINSKAEVYILNSHRGEMRKYTPDGKLLLKWGRWGAGQGEFKDPQAIAIDKDDNIYIADTDNNRIQKFDSEGKFLMEIK